MFFELDQLYKRLNYTRSSACTVLEQHPELVAQRDDLSIEHITLLNLTGTACRGISAPDGAQLPPLGGRRGQGHRAVRHQPGDAGAPGAGEQRPQQAIAYLEQAQVYPPNLGEGKLYGAQENNIFYYLGCAYQALGR